MEFQRRFLQELCVWSDLRDRFDRVNGSRIFTIHRDIGRLVQGNNTISVYYSKLRQLWDEFSSLVTLPSCSCESTKKYLEHDQQGKLLQFLMGLNESYVHIRSQILMINPLPTVSQAFAIISQEESHRNLLSVTSVHHETQPSAFYSAQEKRKSSVRCEHCNWQGHTKAQCYKLIGYPLGHRFYKGQPKGAPQNNNRDGYQKHKPNGKANASVTHSDESEQVAAEISSTGQFFTPEQYSAILKLLAKEQSSSEFCVPTANMAGPIQWEDTGDW